MSNELISIIVPVYNTEKYLRRCLDSVVSQTYKKIEVILVDDGSCDGSGEICDEYAEKDCRVTVLHKENEGLVRARKDGAKISNGSYVMLVDSDDWIDQDAVEKMVMIQKKYDCDMLQASVIYEEEDGTQISFEEVIDGPIRMQEKSNVVLKNLFIDEEGAGVRKVRSNIWGCLFERELYLEYQMNVPDNMRRGEDDACYFPMILSCNTFCIIREGLYHFYQRGGSMSRSNVDFGEYEGVDLYKIIYPKIINHPAKDILIDGFKKYLILRTNDHFLHSLGIGYRRLYTFPFSERCKGKKVVIYGAGVVGKSYISWLEMCKKDINIVALIDSYKNGRIIGKKIEKDFTGLKKGDYEYIIIAVLDEKAAKQIKNDLVSKGVDPDKILWERPILNDWMYRLG